MADNGLTLSDKDQKILLRTVETKDIEKLRKWKNQHRHLFFYNKIITKAQQSAWFEEYKKRKNDKIFMVEYLDKEIGCIGFRIIEDYADIYNVILGEKKFAKKGLMSLALGILCSYILDCFDKDIALKVLTTNDARLWYKKNGFIDVYKKDNFIFMKLDKNNFNYIGYTLKKS